MECTVDLIRRYVGGFAGACFDPRMDEPWWCDDRFNSSDVYKVAALSMPNMITAERLEAFCEIFDRDAADADASMCDSACTAHQTCILKKIPARADIWNPSAAFYIDMANTLWKMLYEGRPKGIGETGINKLVTHKRPYLLPVVDVVSKERMRLGNGRVQPRDHWQFFHDEVNPMPLGLLDAIHEVRARAAVPKWTSDIRVIDIAIWMEHKHSC